MQCASCGSESPDGAKFCIECAAPFKKRCPSCGVENLPRAKFCSECATPLTSQSGVQSPESGVQKGLESRQDLAERRQLTVMFCDLVGSTALSAQLDPEELREVVRAYQEACAAVIERYEGHIAQYLGDGLLVYFGYPVAHEDDAQRAVRAGLEIVAALQNRLLAGHEVPSPLAGEGQGEGVTVRAVFTHSPPPGFPPPGGREKTRLAQRLQVRIGIHTGLVVVGEIGSGEKRELLALGETPNIAARMQSIAEPNAVVLSATAHRLVAGYLACQSLGMQDLKGLPQPLEVYRVVGESGARGRVEIAITTGLTPLVGRDEEVGLLLKRWEQVREGQGQVVLLSGEAGIGKSRLLQVLKERAANEASTRLECRCSPYYQNTALYPVIDLLQRVLQFRREDSPEEKLNRLESALSRYHFDLKDTMPLFASLLSLPAPRFPLPVLTPQKQKEKTQQAVLTWLLQEAERQPVRFEVEDLHWADPSTLEFLGLLIDQVPTARLLVVLTFRPEFLPPWPPRSHVIPIRLSRLARAQTEAMVERVTDGKALPAEILQQIVSKTDGVPLFVEELTKMVVESVESRGFVGSHNRTPLQSIAIPATQQDSLMARLDRLATVKEVAQLGATLGREFSYELLRAVAPANEASLQQALAKLVEAEVLYQRGLPPQARYLFKHALIQDTAYQSLLKSKRQQYHRQIAQVLEERFSEIKETQPELLAHHYTEASLIVQAIPYWQQAGQRASERSANVEAINHLTKGLELLKTLPNTPERAQQETMLQLALSWPLAATKGFAALEVEQAYTRALELCRQLGETPQLYPVLVRLGWLYLAQGKLQMARGLVEQLLTLAQREQDRDQLLEAHYWLGCVLFFIGEFAPAREHLEQGFALDDPQQHHADCLSRVALVLCRLGYPDQALKRMHEALTLARESSRPFILAQTLGLAAFLHLDRGEVQAAQEQAEAMIALSREHEFALLLAEGTILRGWALAVQGREEEGVTQIRQGLAAVPATGTEVARPAYLALLAEAYGKVGRIEEGLAVLAEALAVVHKIGQYLGEGGLYWLKGELLLKSQVSSPKSQVNIPQSASAWIFHWPRNPQLEAEACFHTAIEIARKQQAKSLELRAVMSLSRLWQQQGKKEEARQMLAEIYGWFTEGFDTADLQEARVLLEELTQ